jgi:hypothetical protein
LVDTTTRIGQTQHSLVALDAASDFAKPSGYRTMASNASLEKPNGNGTAWTTYYHWNVMSRRDSGGGYNGLALGYESGRMWYGQNAVNTALPNWYEIWTEATPQALPTADGSDSAPFYSFNSDPDTGMYLRTTGIGFSVGGAASFRVDGGSVRVSGGEPAYHVYENDAALNEKNWRIVAAGGSLYFQGREDDGQTFANPTFMRFYRTATTAGSVRFYAPLRNADGSNSAPSYSFTNDTDTGMYSAAADTIGFSTAGTARWSLNGTGQFVPATSGNYDIGTTSSLVRNIYSNEFRGENGLVSSPSFTFRTDLDTGMYLGSTGILKFSTAGADRLVVSGTSIENYTVGSGYASVARTIPASSLKTMRRGTTRGSSNPAVRAVGACTLVLMGLTRSTLPQPKSATYLEVQVPHPTRSKEIPILAFTLRLLTVLRLLLAGLSTCRVSFRVHTATSRSLRGLEAQSPRWARPVGRGRGTWARTSGTTRLGQPRRLTTA